MSENINDYDRVALLKQWWDEHGTALIVGLVLGLILIFGWQYWQRQQIAHQIAAASAYQTLTQTSIHKDGDLYAQRALALMKDYPRSPYASLAAFLLAKTKVLDNQFQAAIDANTWVIMHSKDKGLIQIARIRNARLDLALHQPDKALADLATVDDPNFLILIDEVKGDIYAVKKDYDQARHWYLAAQQVAPDSPVLSVALPMKLASLPAQTAE